jgi:cytochrome c553
MFSRSVLLRLLAGFVLSCAWVGIAAAATGLEWDSVEKTIQAKADQPEASIVFTAKNTTAKPITITAVATSCHCTAAQPPRTPWVIAPGGKDDLTVTLDLRGRSGDLTKTVYIYSDSGGDTPDFLLVHVNVPLSPEEQRELNRSLAQVDRQAVLQGDCASCHVTPTIGKQGAELFKTACLICHAAEHRASMVPDLFAPKEKRDAAYWEKMVREGREKTLMPAFAKANGGALDDAQIKSLVAYLVANLPSEPAAKK